MKFVTAEGSVFELMFPRIPSLTWWGNFEKVNWLPRRSADKCLNSVTKALLPFLKVVFHSRPLFVQNQV